MATDLRHLPVAATVTVSALLAGAVGIAVGEAMMAAGVGALLKTAGALGASAAIGAAVGLPFAAQLRRNDHARLAVDSDLARARIREGVAEGTAWAGTWEWDLDTGEVSWSDALRRTFGIGLDAHVDKELFRVLVHPEDRPTLRLDDAQKLEAGAPWSSTFRVVRSDGEIRRILSVGTLAVLDGRRRIIGISIDTTTAQPLDIRSAPVPEAVRPGDASDRQFRDAVQSLLLLAESRARNGGAAARRSQDGVEEAVALVDAIVEVSNLAARRGTAVYEDIRLGEIVESVAAAHRSRAAESGVEIRLVAVDRPCRGDPVLLERLLGAALGDAVVGSPAGGRVIVGCRSEAGGGTSLQVVRKGRNGRQPEAAPPGPRTAVAFRAADVLGAPMTVKSGPIHSLRVSLPPPADPASVPPARGALIDTLVEGGEERLKIVVVEDEPVVRDGIRAALEAWGHQVIAGENLERVSAALDASGDEVPPDLILADYHLVEGSGLEAVESLRKRFGWKVPGILLTGDVGFARGEGASQANLPILIKPIRVDDLRREVAKAVSGVNWTR